MYSSYLFKETHVNLYMNKYYYIITGTQNPVCFWKCKHTADYGYSAIKTNGPSRKQWRANSEILKVRSEVHARKLMELEY